MKNKKSLLDSHPDIAAQWHPTKNGKLTPEQITAGSHKKVWWICSNGHEWDAIISDRTRGRGCPYCSGKRVCEDNNLLNNYPDIAKEWHPKKNKKLTPSDVTYGSTKRVWWICLKGHEWDATVNNRTSHGTGCPYCSGNRINPK